MADDDDLTLDQTEKLLHFQVALMREDVCEALIFVCILTGCFLRRCMGCFLRFMELSREGSGSLGNGQKAFHTIRQRRLHGYLQGIYPSTLRVLRASMVTTLHKGHRLPRTNSEKSDKTC